MVLAVRAKRRAWSSRSRRRDHVEKRLHRQAAAAGEESKDGKIESDSPTENQYVNQKAPKCEVKVHRNASSRLASVTKFRERIRITHLLRDHRVDQGVRQLEKKSMIP